MWISYGTRPNIAFAVNTLTKFTHNPGLKHWCAAIRVLEYLNTTMIYFIRYAQQTATDDIVPQAQMYQQAIALISSY